MPLWSSYAYLQSAKDLDDDGDLDVVLSAESAHILINAGNGAFQELDLPVMIYSVFDCRDFNGDGRLDIMAWDEQSSLVVFLGDDADPYDQTLRLPVAGQVQMLDDPVDLDRDGYLDQVVAWESQGPGTRVMVLWGAAQGGFRAPIDLVFPTRVDGTGEHPFSVAARDTDQDGDFDLVLSEIRIISNGTDRLHPWGDVDGNGRVDIADIDVLSAAIRVHDPRTTLFDLSRDSLLSDDDLTFLVRNILGSQPGDADLDGRFDSSDLVRVFQAGEYEDATSGNSTWAEGDWDGDGDFTTSDMVLAFQAGGYENLAASPILRTPRLRDWNHSPSERRIRPV